MAASVDLGLAASTGLEDAEQEPPEQDKGLFENTPSMDSELKATLAANTNWNMLTSCQICYPGPVAGDVNIQNDNDPSRFINNS